MNWLNKALALTVAIVTVAGAFAGHLLYIGAINTKADIANAKNVEQDEMFDKQSGLLKDISDRTSRMEGMLQILVRRK